MPRLSLLLLLALLPLGLHAANPIITDVFTADPAPLIVGDTVYLYCGQDEAKNERDGYRMNRWLCYSSKDMKTWKPEGSPLAPKDFTWAVGDAWASQVIERNGKFYWYAAVQHDKTHPGKAIGVAVSDNPTGPFKDARGSALVTNDMTKATKISWDDIDPTVFIDEGGQAWLFWGNQKCYYAKLKPGMTELDGPIHVIPDDQVKNFTEAPWLHKRGSLYYLSYATGFPEKMAYSTATSLAGPWTYRGLLSEVAGNSTTIHQGIIRFKGVDYFVYHNGAMQVPNIGGGNRRSVCIDYLYYNPDGTMMRVAQTTEGLDLPPIKAPQPTLSAAADPLSWTNPLIPQRADPHVTLHSDGYYYFTATAPEYDRIELRRARTLGELATAEAKVIWRKHESGPMSASIWAPELHFIDGKWYVYFSAGEAAKNWTAIRPCVLEGEGADPLEARWTEKGRLKLGWESFSLDGTTFTHRGARYFVWTQVEQGVKGTNLYLSRMDTPCSLTGPIVCLSRPDHEWERRGHWVNEGPSVLVKNGRVWLSYSASATDANYCLGLLSTPEDADLLRADSWTKSPGPVFRSDAAASQFGPGHNCFTTTPDGKTDILVYHSRNYEKISGDPLKNSDRATRAQVIRWRADGTPDFGTPVPDGPCHP